MVVAACPSGLVTVTVTAPFVAETGAVTTSWVAANDVTVAERLPKVTVGVAMNALPLIVTG